jgi:uncharacterized cupredoxin-like copper-binding protein
VLALAACAPANASGRSQVVSISIRYSRFTPARVEVRAGTSVRFVITNHDPIDHEFIVGPPAVHERHEKGTERHHGARAGEVTIAAGTTATTTYPFPAAGAVMYACHLPGHFAYGMKGFVVVTTS